jgi:hypothetical protein
MGGEERERNENALSEVRTRSLNHVEVVSKGGAASGRSPVVLACDGEEGQLKLRKGGGGTTNR